MGSPRPADIILALVNHVRSVEDKRAAAVAAAALPYDAELEELYAQLDQAAVSLGEPDVVNGHASNDEAGDEGPLGGDHPDETITTSKTDILIATIRGGGRLDYSRLAAKMYPDEDQIRARKKLRSMMSSLKKLGRIKNVGNRGDRMWEVVR